MFDKILEFMIALVMFLIYIGLIFLIGLITYDWFTWKSCLDKYENSKYDFWWWCKVEYNWKYISEDLYKNAFEKNVNVNLLQ